MKRDRASHRTLIALGANHHRSDVALKALATWEGAVDNSDPYPLCSWMMWMGQRPYRRGCTSCVFCLPVKSFSTEQADKRLSKGGFQ